MNEWRKCANCGSHYLVSDADRITHGDRLFLKCPHCGYENPYGQKVESEEDPKNDENNH